MPAIIVQGELKLWGTIKRDGEWFIAQCPVLDIASQGHTEPEAKRNLIEATELFIQSCLERGTLFKALEELGFRAAPAMKQPTRPRGSFALPIPLLLTAERPYAACHA